MIELQPFQIKINRHPPFIGLFESSCAALEALHALAAAEAQTLDRFRLVIQPYRLAPDISVPSDGGPE